MTEGRRGWAHTALVAAVALAVRAVIASWAAHRFPAIADGAFYDRFASRLAHGLGYTVSWDDGAVTYAAHYPVGYPAIVSLAYRVFGDTPGVAMAVNAIVGTLGAASAHRLARRELTSRVALFASLAVALHPALLLYTPAIMTESVAGSLVLVAAACAPIDESIEKSGSKYVYFAHIAAMGVAFGVATLVRPQVLVLAPLFALVLLPRRGRRRRARIVWAAVVTALALATVLPWTLRNCARMNRCALVSVNGGWNLLIGVHTENGSWTPLESPDACKTVWDEAAKDTCFEHAAREEIASSPIAWLAKAPEKLAVTFDAFNAGPWYLHQSNPRAFDDHAAFVAGAIETAVSRAVLVAALVASAPLWRLRVRRKSLARTLPRLALAAIGLAFAASRHAWPAYALLSFACFAINCDERRSPLRIACGVVIAATMATHAVFFGAGRYGLFVVPFVTLAAFACVRPKALSASVSSASGR